MRSGAIEELNSGTLVPTTRYYTPRTFGDDFVHSMIFSFSNLVNTLVRNMQYSQESDRDRLMREGLFERYVWSNRLDRRYVGGFKRLAEEKAAELLTELDEWIGARERRVESDGDDKAPLEEDEGLVGLGVYLFCNDQTEV